MELKVGDIVVALHNSLQGEKSCPYKVIELRDGDNKIPSLLQKITEDGREVGSKIRDGWNHWHTYKWIIYKPVETIPLSEADKKYEKIILKIRTLDSKFKIRKELK